MKFTQLTIPDVVLIEPSIIEDERGYFFESFNLEKLRNGIDREITFVQSNESFSKQNVIRGLHYQIRKAQGKLVRVASGTVYDIAVDLRRDSPSFGQWVGDLLSADNHHQLWIPEGFAHGFQVISTTATLQYMVTEYWYPQYDRCIRFDDADIGISWKNMTLNDMNASEPLISPKDKAGHALACAEVF